MAIINNGMRKVIKGMVVTCQTSQFISLMPKPQDFITRIVGDAVYLSAKVQKLSEDINRLLDQYADIPTNYLMTQVNSMMDSAGRIVDRVNTFAQNGVNQVMGFGENTMDTVSGILDTSIDMVSETSKAVVSLGGAVVHTSTSILGNEYVATDVHAGTEVILEWTDNGFENVKSTVVNPIVNTTQKITDAKNQANGYINDKMTIASNDINQAQNWIGEQIENLRKMMDKLSMTMDKGFGDVTGINSISKGANYVSTAMKDSEYNDPIIQATGAMTDSMSNILKNFSISKVVLAFGGVLIESGIVKLGLDKLPPIDFESMLNQLQESVKKTPEFLFGDYSKLLNKNEQEIMVLNDIDSKDFSPDRYNEFIKQFDEDLKSQRDKIRLAMNDRKNNIDPEIERYKDLTIQNNEKREIKSAIKEVEKLRKKAKNAKQSSKFKSVLSEELTNLKKEVEIKCDNIKLDWLSMMDQYKKAIKEIKSFFQNGGDGDMFIDDCCDAINKDCDDIKDLCKNLGTQLIASTIKVAMPADIGAVVPNPVYKISDFWMDVKTIIKFIKDLITLIMDIINNINKLVRIMLNGLNNLKELFKQLMELLGIKWFMNLVQSIIDMFGGKIKDAKVLLENMISPIYYKDTEEYNNTLEVLENMVDDNGNYIFSDDVQSLKDNIYHKIEINEKIKLENLKIVHTGNADMDEKGYEKLIEEIEKKADDIVAYKSPMLDPNEKYDGVNVSDLMNGGSMNTDIKFIGWHFFHPDLDHVKSGLTPFMRKIKSKIIKKASKKSSNKRGGMYMMNHRNVKKGLVAYDAFYWYTYYTEDLEKDCFEFSTPQNAEIVDSIVQTQNGSIVDIGGKKVFIADNMVKSGDYVTVDGVRYRVK